MSQAEDLLNTMAEEDEIVYHSDTEAHIVVNADRTITVPDELKFIAVQYDNNVETVTFDCPRYWDEHDFSTMNIYVNYERSDGHPGQYPVKNLRIDDNDDTILHFEWTITNDVTMVSGKVSFLVCVKNLEVDTLPHWNSRLNQELIVEPGMEPNGAVVERSPDIIEMMLSRLYNLERANNLVLIDQNTGVYYNLYIVDGTLTMNRRGG